MPQLAEEEDGRHSPRHDGPQEAGRSLHHLQPHGGHGALVEERGLGQGAQGVQGLLKQLAAQVRVLAWAHARVRAATPSPRNPSQEPLQGPQRPKLNSRPIGDSAGWLSQSKSSFSFS